PNIRAYTSYLQNGLIQPVELVVEHKADVNHVIVGAASILAKVCRDAEVERLKQEIGIDFGSGYMTDVKTKKFLQEKWDVYPQIFRHSWAPYRRMFERTIE